MKLVDWLTIAALLVGPLLALVVSFERERRRQLYDRRFAKFRTLMATRATRLSPDHVQALNMIDIEFHGGGSKSREIVQAWRVYLDHLNNETSPPQSWGERQVELFIDLLYKMAVYFDYKFDVVHLKRTSYFPRGLGELDSDQIQIRKKLLAMLSGNVVLPVKITDNGETSTSDPDL